MNSTISTKEKSSQVLTSQYFELTSTPPKDIAEDLTVNLMQAAIVDFNALVAHFAKGFKGRSARDSSWGHFFNMEESSRRQAIEFLNSQNAYLRQAIQSGLGDSFDEIKMLTYAMNQFSILFSSDLMDYIESDDVVEIVDEEFKQVYRSYSCFSLCNYSILELATYPWYELYDRPNRITKLSMDCVEDLMSGGKPILSLLERIPEYILREKFTEERAAFRMREKFIMKAKSALTGNNFIVTVKRIEPLEEQGSDEIRFL